MCGLMPNSMWMKSPIGGSAKSEQFNPFTSSACRSFDCLSAEVACFFAEKYYASLGPLGVTATQSPRSLDTQSIACLLRWETASWLPSSEINRLKSHGLIENVLSLISVLLDEHAMFLSSSSACNPSRSSLDRPSFPKHCPQLTNVWCFRCLLGPMFTVVELGCYSQTHAEGGVCSTSLKPLAPPYIAFISHADSA